jgi:outer membrane protein, multidrug efflux system
MHACKNLTILSLLVFAGCTVGPTYTAPTLPEQTPDAWFFATTNSFQVGSNDVADWWYKFDDPELVSLIADAQQTNVTLKIAYSNLLQSRATYGIASAKLVPTITAGGNAQREQGSNNSPTLANFPNVQSKPVNDFSVGLDSSWEIDLWGGIEKNIEASSAMEGVALENYHDALITLRAEVASTYINIRVLQISKALTKQSIETLRALLTLIESQYEQGVISMSTLETERAMYDQNTTQLPEIEMQLVQEYARLAVLIGSDTHSTIRRLSQQLPVPRATPNVAVGIPSDLIRRRPDIREAERTLAAQTALVGAKIANLYPKLSLSGSFGYEATETNDIIRWDSRAWSVGPTVSWDLFNGNRIRSQVQLQEEKANEAFLNWELTVLRAFAEVETSLSNLSQSGKVQDIWNDASKSLYEAYELTKTEEEAGVVQMQTVLNAKRNFVNSQIMLVEKTGIVSQGLVSLYKSLGGDWENEIGLEITQVRDQQ